MKVSKKARHGRRRRPRPHRPHRNAGATQDPLVRARRADHRRARLAAALAAFFGEAEHPFLDARRAESRGTFER